MSFGAIFSAYTEMELMCCLFDNVGNHHDSSHFMLISSISHAQVTRGFVAMVLIFGPSDLRWEGP